MKITGKIGGVDVEQITQIIKETMCDYASEFLGVIAERIKGIVVLPADPAKATGGTESPVICYGCKTPILSCPYAYDLRTEAQGCQYKTVEHPAKATGEDAPKLREPRGFVKGQAIAWEDVWDLCIKLGMAPVFQSEDNDVCAFIRDLHARANDLENKFGFTYCAFCGSTFACDAPDAAEAISKHIDVCSKHPMRAVEKERDDWKRRAEEERYSVEEIAAYCARTLFDTDDSELNILEQLNDPQSGIKAVTNRREHNERADYKYNDDWD